MAGESYPEIVPEETHHKLVPVVVNDEEAAPTSTETKEEDAPASTETKEEVSPKTETVSKKKGDSLYDQLMKTDYDLESYKTDPPKKKEPLFDESVHFEDFDTKVNVA